MRLLTCILCLILFISSCRDKVICPAFQSTYILDDSVRLAYFSYLWELDDKDRISYLENRRNTKDSLVALSSDTLTIDSIPGSKMGEVDYFAYVEPLKVPIREVKKNKYGIIKYEPYWLKNYRMRTAPMENVLKPEPEEEIQPLADEDLLADIEFDSSLTVASEGDSLGVSVDITGGVVSSDSIQIPESEVLAKAEPAKAEKKKPRFLFGYDPKDDFNVEQAYYNKWFGEQLVYKEPKPKPPVEPLAKDSAAMDAGVVDPSNLSDENAVDDSGGPLEEEQNNPVEEPATDQNQTPEEEVVTEEPQEEEQPVPQDQPAIEIESVPQDDGF